MADHPRDSPRLEELRRRLEKDPASIAFAQLAEEYRRSAQLAEAVEVCRNGLVRHPGYSSARVTLGRALLELGQLDDARRELELVLKTAPENLAAIRGLADIHHTQGAHAEALSYYKAALALAKNDPELDKRVSSLHQFVREAEPPAPPAPIRATAADTRTAEGGTELNEAEDDLVRTIAALEGWLTIITTHHAAGTESRS